MWDLSYHWQRRARVAAGIAVLVGSVGAAIGLSRTPAAVRTWNGVRELAGEIRAADEQQVVVSVPADLAARAGSLVYSDREDGVAQVVGRVVGMQVEQPDRAQLTIRLMGPLADRAQFGGVLRGASASLDLRDAMELLVSPNTPAEEALRARDIIWPSVTTNVMPRMADSLIREVSQELASLDERDQELLTRSFQQLHEELKPLEDELVNRIARRAWEVVGVKGVTAGLWSKATDNVQNQGTAVAYWLWQLLGNQPVPQPRSRPFLSEETNAALQEALKDEAVAFWREHHGAILAAVARVVEQRRPEFEAAFKERWAGMLFERAVVPAWQAGEQQVLEAVQVYANDFASRRLLTKAGGPRLMFAFALRSSLDISNDPLLVFSPGSAAGSGKIEYEPLVR